ncbi:MAG: GTP-binding protein, partial [Anaerolineae bacterium]|nr:GTP-binding protein [Anaerolineae bacterium]
QVEFANIIVINKTDLAAPEKVTELENVLRKLNPDATLIRTAQGRIDVSQILNTGIVDMEAAQRSPGWLKELEGEHTPETEEYGISSFVFKARRPFHPQRLMDIFEGEHMGSVLRSKGFFWIATRHDEGIRWSLAGSMARISPAGSWFAATPVRMRPKGPEIDEYLREYWEEPYGDRRQELVFIGIQMAKEALIADLQAALLSDAELALGEEGWQLFPDPFPVAEPDY